MSSSSESNITVWKGRFYLILVSLRLCERNLGIAGIKAEAPLCGLFLDC
jgi:hypothetical protein